ncbi:hypothetical protein HDV01_005925 [Terramyces sp. JEL0728]|nr:hypothetical protein HDV01_005925 [Terramyces sp. JEL0728]
MGCQNSKILQVYPEEQGTKSVKADTPTTVHKDVDTNQLKQFIKTKHEAVALSASASHNFTNSSQSKNKGPALLGSRYKFHESTGSLEELKDPPEQIFLITDRSTSNVRENCPEKEPLPRNITVDEQEDMMIRKVGMMSGASSMAFQVPDNVAEGPIAYKDAYSLIKKGQDSNTKSSDPNVKTLQKIWTSNNSICFAPLIFSAAGSIHTEQTNETDSVTVEKDERPLRKSFTTYKMKNETLVENVRSPYPHENLTKVLDLKRIGNPSNYTSAPFPVEFFANKITNNDPKQTIQSENINDIKKRLIDKNFPEEISKDSVGSSENPNSPSASKEIPIQPQAANPIELHSQHSNAEARSPYQKDNSHNFKTGSHKYLETISLEQTPIPAESDSLLRNTNESLQDQEKSPAEEKKSSVVSFEIPTVANDKKLSVVSLIYLPEGQKPAQTSVSFPILYGFQEPKVETKKIASAAGINPDSKPNADIFIKSIKEAENKSNPEPVKYSSIVSSGDMIK